MKTTAGKKEITHDRIVDAAARAIRRAGYRGVGVAEVMKDAGLTHGGFYAHFGSRDELLVEATRRAGRENALTLGEAVDRRRAQGESAFAALVRSYLHPSQVANLESGCVVAALASEMPRQDPALVMAARERVTALIERVASSLPAAAQAGEAEVIAATMVGALQLARTLGGKAGRDLLLHTAESLVARHAAEPSG